MEIPDTNPSLIPTRHIISAAMSGRIWSVAVDLINSSESLRLCDCAVVDQVACDVLQ